MKIIPILAALSMCGVQFAACAADASPGTLDKIKDAGVIALGVKDASGVVSFLGADGSTGFHVDVCKKVVEKIKEEIKKPDLKVKYVSVTNVNRIPLMLNGTVDLGCETMTNTVERAKSVTFAPTTWIDTMPALVNVKSTEITKIADLKGKKVSTASGSISQKGMRSYMEKTGNTFTIMGVKDNDEAFLLLETGRVDAFVNDSQIGASFRAASKDPTRYRFVKDVVFVTQPQALYYRQGDPKFAAVVDSTIEDLLKSGEIKTMYDKWFMQPVPPRKNALDLPPSEVLQDAWDHPNRKPMEDYKMTY